MQWSNANMQCTLLASFALFEISFECVYMNGVELDNKNVSRVKCRNTLKNRSKETKWLTGYFRWCSLGSKLWRGDLHYIFLHAVPWRCGWSLSLKHTGGRAELLGPGHVRHFLIIVLAFHCPYSIAAVPRVDQPLQTLDGPPNGCLSTRGRTLETAL